MHAITRECSLDCLKSYLSPFVFDTLHTYCLKVARSPATAGDVVDLYLKGQLPEIGNLGPKRITRITRILMDAGLITNDHQQDALKLTRIKQSLVLTDVPLLRDVKFLTVAEIAVAMRVSKMTVYRLIRSGELKSIRVGRSYRVPEQTVQQYLGDCRLEQRTADSSSAENR